MPTHYAGPPEEVLALDTFVKLSRAMDGVWKRLNRGLEGSGLTQAQLAVVEALHFLGPMPQRDLARKLLRSAANLTVLVDGLEKRGLVVRERREDDRRVADLHLTPAGAALVARVFPEHARRVAEAFSVLTPDEQAVLGQLARKLGLGLRSLEQTGDRDVEP